MAQWAYASRSCADDHIWWVARDEVAAMAPGVAIVRVKVGAEWRCARVDRSRAVEVDAQLLRQVVASGLNDCRDCGPAADASHAATAPAETEVLGPSMHAAAITIAGRSMVVVLVPLDVVRSPGEAEMLADELRPRFGGADIVLMGQEDDGTPVYHGEAGLLALLEEVPLERMPWKAYPPV